MIQHYGRHRITNASIEHPILDQMLSGVTVGALYSDPPWGDGNMKYWVTMNKKMTGAEYAPISYHQLLERIFELAARYVDGFVCIETGMRWGDQIARMMPEHGLHHVRKFRLQYRAGGKMLDNLLLIGGTARNHEFPLSGYDDLYECYGAELVERVLGMIKPKTAVLDPCCGMGYTARAAVKHGLAFYGNEFNAKRLAKTTAFLEAHP